MTKDRSDLSQQLTMLQRKKENLVEDLARLKQKYEQSLEMTNRVNKNLEDLVKECEEKEVCGTSEWHLTVSGTRFIDRNKFNVNLLISNFNLKHFYIFTFDHSFLR